MKLEIELIPSSAFESNVRSMVKKSEWDRIRKKAYKKAGYVCEICGGVGKRHPIECHEVWDYDAKTTTQTLKGLVALCPACHCVKHWGLSKIRGLTHLTEKQFMKVNEVNEDKLNEHLESVWTTWEFRNFIKWKQDISFLDNY